jgi:hypothetical protein
MPIELLHVVPTLPGVWHAATPVMSGCGGLSLQWHQQNGTMQSIAGSTEAYGSSGTVAYGSSEHKVQGAGKCKASAVVAHRRRVLHHAVCTRK